MKKFLSLFMVAAILCSMIILPASAETPTYKTTKAFLKKLDAKNFTYTFEGKDRKDYEIVRVPMSGDNFDFAIKYFFEEDSETVSVRVWDIITFKQSDLSKVLKAVNELNDDYRFVTFVVDESDNTVYASMDLIVCGSSNVDEILWDTNGRVTSIVDAAYPSLEPYDK